MHIGGGPSKCWIFGLEPSGAGQAGVMGTLSSGKPPSESPRWSRGRVPRLANPLMAQAIAGRGQDLQALVADGLPAGFAPPVGPFFEASQCRIDVVEIIPDLVEPGVVHLLHAFGTDVRAVPDALEGAVRTIALGPQPVSHMFVGHRPEYPLHLAG
jgi:hypothetical protein